MKTIKAHTLEELKRKVLATPLFLRIEKRRDELVSIIDKLRSDREYIDRDLKEELQECRMSLKVSTAYGYQSIKRGVFGNKPYCGSGNLSCVTWVFKGENTKFYTYRISSN